MKSESIILKLKNGDTQALKYIYELYYKQVFRAAFFITNDISLAEDAVHEVFLKLPNKIKQLEDPSKLEAWLCRIATNLARDIIRQRLGAILFAEVKDINSDNQSNSPEAILLIHEVKQIIKHHINNLQPEHKRVIYLKYYEDLSINEISTILGIPVNTVKSRLIRAREELKKLLDPEGYLNHRNENRVRSRKK